MPCNVKFSLKVGPGSPCGEKIAKSAFPNPIYSDVPNPIYSDGS